MSAVDVARGTEAHGLLGIDPSTFAAHYDRRPFAFRHSLADHPLLTWPELTALIRRMPREKVLHRVGPVPLTTNFDRAHVEHPHVFGLEETLERIQEAHGYIVVNTPEVDPEFRPLVGAVIDELKARLATIDPGLYWYAAYLFVSAGGSVTPYHMDREQNFLLQIRGSKEVQLWQPDIMTPEERERLMTDWTGPRPTWRESHQACVQRFPLAPGDGVHHPFIAPHAVVNGSDLSVSLAVTFRTRGTDRKTNVYKVNQRLRRLGLRPSPPGAWPLGDRVKSRGYAALASLAHLAQDFTPSAKRRRGGTAPGSGA